MCLPSERANSAAMGPRIDLLLSPLPCCLLPFLFFLALQTSLSLAADTISRNNSLSGGQTLISQQGTFALGFFKPGNSSQNQYLGIWYNKVSQPTQVWVPNRATPVTDPATSELRISGDGNLVLLDQSKSQIWSSNVSIPSGSTTVAVLVDSGNLVLRDGYSNFSKVLWQSFDHPTDTWLPGAKLGLDKVTGKGQQLTAWKNSEDPAPGIFSLELDPAGSRQFIIQWNRSKIYWNSGNWNGEIFSLLYPSMTGFYWFESLFVDTSTENYFIYWIKGDGIFLRYKMDVSGQIKPLIWIESANSWSLFWSKPRDQCQVYALCGPFGSCNEFILPFCNCVKGFRQNSARDWASGDQTGGCVRNTQLQCGGNSSANVEQDKFFPMLSVRLPENSQALEAGSDEDCGSACLSNCSCTAYSYDDDSGCFVWHGGLVNIQEQYSGSDAATLYLRLAASELPGSISKKGVVIGAVVGGIVGLVAFLVIVWVLVWRHRRRRKSGALKTFRGALVPFTYSELQRATKNFSVKLGGGGFGSVFKGMLPDSTTIAVKKLEGIHQGEKQFRAEVSTLGTIQHLNLIRLLGFCSEGNKRLLVYEYVPKGSLDAQLFQNSSTVLDWHMRYQIALGIARGLAYLHENCRDTIIHCDIKPENILLDESFVPKVADFGLAKVVGREFSRVLTTVRGTIGYLAPEWITGAAITTKADVYSYGMLLFEIISGRRNTDHTEEGTAGFFPTLAAGKLVEGNAQSLLDLRLQGIGNLPEVEIACKVACWCIQDDENSRPTMGQVVQILQGYLQADIPPIPRSLQNILGCPQSLHFISDLSSTQSSSMRSTNSTTPPLLRPKAYSQRVRYMKMLGLLQIPSSLLPDPTSLCI